MPCLICKSNNLKEFLNLGETALANNFLSKSELENNSEDFFPLRVSYCGDCYHVQLLDLVNPKLMFDNYLYISSASKTLVNHLKSLAKKINNEISPSSKDIILDVGSNDGSLLNEFYNIDNSFNLIGIEPAKNLVKSEQNKKFKCINNYLIPDVAEKIVSKFGKVKIITSTNSFPHIHDLHEFIKSIQIMMSKDSVFIIEAHYLIDLINENAFDTIYHEHVSYWSVLAIKNLLSKFDLEIFNVERLPIHHGQIRVWIKKKNSDRFRIKKELDKILQLEEKFGLNKSLTFTNFEKKIKKNKIKFTTILNNLLNEGKSIVGYGAPAKGNTLLTYFKIDKSMIKFISDKNKLKQNKFSPGQHIPIFSERKILDENPDYVMILAWNFADEIIDQLQDYRKQGGKFIIPIPEFKII